MAINFLRRLFNLKVKNSNAFRRFDRSIPLTLSSVNRQRNMPDSVRRKASTELTDTYYGFGLPYLRDRIKETIKNSAVKQEMFNIAVALPLLKKFMDSISRVYTTNPIRRFYDKDGKQIVDDLEEFQDSKNYNKNPKLYKKLTELYNEEVEATLKQAESLTNLLNTTIYKVITTEQNKTKIVFIENDIVQINQQESDATKAKDIVFIKDQYDSVLNLYEPYTLEMWNSEVKIVPIEDDELSAGEEREETTVNEASLEAEKLFGYKQIGYAFAPFVVFRSGIPSGSFWDNKDDDVVQYIKAINMSLTELRYLVRYASFGLKYTVNIKVPKDGVLDPQGIIQFGADSSGAPGSDNSKNWDIGEFDNSGRIKEVIDSIVFNMKMLFNMYNLPLDSLISSNSVRSAENKEMDNEELFDYVNKQREIWNLNEQHLFKVLMSVYNRDNKDNIPVGITLQVNFEELETKEKVNADWVTEIENNVSSYLDWLKEKNPDLDREELQRLFEDNKNINDVVEEENEEGDDDKTDKTNVKSVTKKETKISKTD